MSRTVLFLSQTEHLNKHTTVLALSLVIVVFTETVILLTRVKSRDGSL